MPNKTPKDNIEEMAGEIVSAFQSIEDSAHEVATDVYGEFETWLSGYLKDQVQAEVDEEVRALLQEINRVCEEDGITDSEGETPVFSYWSERKPHGLKTTYKTKK